MNSEPNFTPYVVRSCEDAAPPLSEEARERDRKMDERIEELRKKQLRREKLTYDEWHLIQYASQQCHCGQRTV